MFSKDLIIGIIPSTHSTNIFIPELTYILRSKQAMTILSNLDPGLFHELKTKLLDGTDKENPSAVLSCSIFEATNLLERIYATLLKAKIALPPTVHSNELQDWLKTTEKENIKKIPQFSYSLSLNDKDLGFFGRNFAWIGSIVTYTLIIGASLASATSVFNWGWSYLLIAMFAGSRLIANYHDIINGPENRMRKIGINLDRYFSDPYQGIGQYSSLKLGIYFLSSGIMLCSAYLAFNFSISTVETIYLIDSLPAFALNPLSYFFACSVAYSHFSRIFNSVFDTIASKLKGIFDLKDSRENERLDLEKTLKIITQKGPQKVVISALNQKSTYLGFSKTKKKDTSLSLKPNDSKKPEQEMKLAKARYAS